MGTFRLNLPATALRSLERLACSAPRQYVSADQGATLVRNGFAITKAGVLTITTLGRAKLVFELTRASWESVAA